MSRIGLYDVVALVRDVSPLVRGAKRTVVHCSADVPGLIVVEFLNERGHTEALLDLRDEYVELVRTY